MTLDKSKIEKLLLQLDEEILNSLTDSAKGLENLTNASTKEQYATACDESMNCLLNISLVAAWMATKRPMALALVREMPKRVAAMVDDAEHMPAYLKTEMKLSLNAFKNVEKDLADAR